MLSLPDTKSTVSLPYKTTSLTTNTYQLSLSSLLKDNSHIYQYSLQLTFESGQSAPDSLLDSALKFLKPQMSKVFGIFGTSGKMLWSTNLLEKGYTLDVSIQRLKYRLGVNYASKISVTTSELRDSTEATAIR
jgi:hypothetical protein